MERRAVNIMELSELWPLAFVEVYLCSPKVYLSNFPSIFIVGGSFPKLFDLIHITLDFITLKFIFVLMGHYITGGKKSLIPMCNFCQLNEVYFLQIISFKLKATQFHGFQIFSLFFIVNR